MPKRRGRLPGQCSICKHLEQVRAELLLAGGASLHAVASKFGMGYYSLRRHWQNHVPPERRARLVLGPVQIQELSARVAQESESILDHHRAVRAGLYGLYRVALDAGDGAIGAMLAGRLTEVNNAIGRLTGQLAASPLVQLNQTNIFVNDPAFASFQADLIRVLSRFPDARDAVLAEFERLETAPALPALEHHSDATEAA